MSDKYWKAKKLFEKGMVLFDNRTPNFFYFKIAESDKTVIYDVRAGEFKCTCEHGSFWGVKKDELCYHCMAVKTWLKNKKVIG